MSKGDIVIFNEKEHLIEWIYDTGYCEIKDIDNIKYVLVHMSELKIKQ